MRSYADDWISVCERMNETGKIMFRGFILIVCLLKTSCQGNTESFRNLSRTKRQSSDLEHCLLPDHPANGELKIYYENKPYLPNGSVILNTIIDLSCNDGYLTETGGPIRAICYLGNWKPNISRIGKCARRCPLVKAGTNALHVVCKRKNREINCGNSAEGTVLEVVCKPFYEIANALNTIRCVDGTWDSKIPPCEPVCGKKGVGVQPLIIGGATAIKAEYPWVAGVYNSSDKEFLGGATIISPSFLLSAADIFIEIDGTPKGKNNEFVIAGGKHYRIFNDRHDNNMQTSRIQRIYIPNGDPIIKTGDFAIVKLEYSFAMTEYVQPVCIDLRNLREGSDLRDGNEGIIAGWGFTEGNRSLAEELKVLTVSIIPKSPHKCVLQQDIDNRFYTEEKICARNKDAGVCTGDTGGGLFFRNSDSRFYIRGILSLVSIIPYEHHCVTNGFALYTKVSYFLSDIAKETGWTIDTQTE